MVRLEMFLTFLAALALAVCVPIVARADSEKSRLTEGLLHEVNMHRALNGASALRLNAKLSTAAQKHAEDMAKRGFFGHRSPDGRVLEQRVSKEDYFWEKIAENLFAGMLSPKAIAETWMTSAGHRANMINGDFNDAGVGYFPMLGENASARDRYYWVIVFGSRSDKPPINNSYRRAG